MGKPYRSERFTESDRIYTKIIKKSFSQGPNKMQEAFNEFTQDLMEEECISRHLLLDAVCNFRGKHNIELNEKESIMWNSFKDIVFRCHPHIDCYWKDDASDDHQDEIDLETIEIKISVDE